MAVSDVNDLFGSTWEKVKESPLMKQVVDYAEESANVIAPYVKKGVDYAEEGVTVIVPCVKKGVDYAEEGVTVIVPCVKKAGDYAQEGKATLSKTLDGSFTPSEDIWKLITEKVNETICSVADFLPSTWEKVKESPVVKQVMDYAEEGVTAIVPCVKKAAKYLEEGVNLIVPYVKKGVNYIVETIQQHPYLAGSIALLVVLLVLWKYCGGFGGCAGGKMMKAPGAGYMMLRSSFESSPKNYFQGLRGKTVFDGTKLV